MEAVTGYTIATTSVILLRQRRCRQKPRSVWVSAGFPVTLEIRKDLENKFYSFQTGKLREFDKNSKNQVTLREFETVNIHSDSEG